MIGDRLGGASDRRSRGQSDAMLWRGADVYLAISQSEYLIKVAVVAVGQDLMGNHEYGLAGLNPVDRIVNHRCRCRVDGRGRLIQDENGRLFEERSRKTDALALTGGERATSFSDNRVVTLCQCPDEVMSVGMR